MVRVVPWRPPGNRLGIMGRSCTFLTTAAILAGALLPAAEAPSRPVTLTVVAVDNRGEPVGDLAAADLQVQENGKPQQIAWMRHIDTRSRRPSPLGPNEFSNRSPRDAGHATVILFDLLNEHFDARGPAWNELIHALEPLESSDGVYLYLLTMNGRLFPVHGLPRPEHPGAPAETSPWTRQAKPLLDQAMKAVLMARPIEILIDERIRMTYLALEALAGNMAGIPGRKNILWITHGVPISLSPRVTGADWIDYTPYLRQLSEKLERANVSIYPVQQIPPGMAMQGTPEAQHSGIGDEDTLQEFARYTGGRPNTSSSIREALKQGMNDARTGYQIGYYPAGVSRDGKFHKLKVTCARKGIRIQTKEGYYAWPEQPFSDESEKQALVAAATAPTDAAEIGMRIRATRTSAQEGSMAVEVDAGDVLLTQQAGQYTGELKLMLAAIDADGTAQGSSVIAMSLKFTQAQYDDAMKSGITFQQPMAIPAVARKIRLAVLDARSGAVGAVTIPVSGIGAAGH